MQVIDQESEKFDPGQFPQIKPTLPPQNKKLRTCGICRRPGYIYVYTNRGRDNVYTIHYNEPPISVIRRHGIPEAFRYRRCFKDRALYTDLDEALDSKVKRYNPRIIKCPRCGKKGRINSYHPDSTNNPQVVRYFVVHEKLEGTWGKSKLSKRRRCYVPTYEGGI